MASLGSPILDCFRNGSVVQLKSKVTSRTLTLEEGRIVNGNGPVGFYAGPVAPRTPVWGRWTDGTYHRGTMIDVDTQFHIKFSDGDTISHDIHDQTAVLADVQPDPEVVQTGSRIIAQFRGSAKYYAGRITKVDRANPSNPRCDIHFDDGDKDSVNLNVIRMLPEGSSRTPPIATNSRVLGRWTNNQYYRGRVTGVGSKVDITFDDGDKVQHDFSDVSAVICDVNPKAGIIQMGSRVVGFWPSSKTFYLGKVVQVDFRNPHQPRYFVRFDDGDQIWCTLNEIRPVPMSRESVGCVVWGRWTNSLYYHGCVTGTSGGKIYVTFDDGDKVSHDLKDVSAVIIDAVPNPASIPVGSRVIGAWPGKSHFYKGTVKQIDPTNSCAPRYLVTYDDGDKSWVSFDQIRLLPMQTTEAQFTAVQIGGNVVALKSVAFPQYFLGTDGKKLIGKVFDNYCHFYVHEAPDQYVSLEFCMSPGQHVGVNSDGTATAPASTHKSNQAFFEVKLLFSPYGQAYYADHCHTGGYPAPTPGYPQPGPYPTPPSGGGYPAPSPGGYPQPGGCPGGYPTGSHPPPPSGGYPGGYPSAPPAGGGYPAGGYPGGYPTGYAPAPGGYPGTQPPPPGGYPGGFPSGPHPPPSGGYPGGFPPGTQPPPPRGYPGYGAHPP